MRRFLEEAVYLTLLILVSPSLIAFCIAMSRNSGIVLRCFGMAISLIGAPPLLLAAGIGWLADKAKVDTSARVGLRFWFGDRK